MEEKLNITLAPGDKEVRIHHVTDIAVPLPRIRDYVLDGNLASVIDYASKRPEIISKNNCYLEIYSEKGLAVLIIGDHPDYDSIIVKGSLTENSDLMALGINREKQWSITNLRNTLKLKRHLFPSRDEHGALMKALEDFTAKTQVEFTQANDYAGNVAHQKIVRIQQSIPLVFNLNVAPYIGYPKEHVIVTIEVIPDNGSLVMVFVSPDLVDATARIREDGLQQVKDALKDIPHIIK